MEFLNDLSKDVVAGLIGTLIGITGKAIFDLFVKYQKDRLILEFLNFPPGKILIIHSALFDESRVSYNYPSCDMIASRKVANLLELVGKKEGVDFSIAPEANFLTQQGIVDINAYNFNLILLGGPKRNKVVGEVLSRAVKPRYDMYQDAANQNLIYDNRIRRYLIASRDEIDQINDVSMSKSIHPKDEDNLGHDYGLIMSMANPLNLELGVLILAGIHGPGTVGAAHFISDKDNLQELTRKRKGNMIQEVVSVDFESMTEQIIDVSMV